MKDRDLKKKNERRRKQNKAVVKRDKEGNRPKKVKDLELKERHVKSKHDYKLQDKEYLEKYN